MRIAKQTALLFCVLFFALSGCRTTPSPTQPAIAPPSPAAKPFVQAIPGTKLSFRMMPIPAGRFRMGSPAGEPGRKADEGPQVEVIMDDFHIAECEVDWAMYNEFLQGYARVAQHETREYRRVVNEQLGDAVTYPTPIYDLEAGPILQRMGGRTEGLPAVIMSRYAAMEFTKWLTKKTGRFYRLPTEAEWEYACRAGTTTAYIHGDDPNKLDHFAWYVNNSAHADGDPGYQRVASKPANAWGLKNMQGNVAEWVFDEYDATWYSQLADRGGPISWSEAIKWPTSRYPGVIRGGGYESEAPACRSAHRWKATPAMNMRDPCFPKSQFYDVEGFAVGFRVVSPARTPSAAEQQRFWQADAATKAVLQFHDDRMARELIEPPAAKP